MRLEACRGAQSIFNLDNKFDVTKQVTMTLTLTLIATFAKLRGNRCSMSEVGDVVGGCF